MRLKVLLNISIVLCRMFPGGYSPKRAGQGGSLWFWYLVSMPKCFLKCFCGFSMPATIALLGLVCWYVFVDLRGAPGILVLL